MTPRSFPRVLLAAMFAGSLGTAAAQVPVTDRTGVERALEAAGYTDVRDVDDDADDGLWEAEVRSADGAWHDVHVVAATGEVLDHHTPGAPTMDARQVEAALADAGYSDITNLELEGGVWEADAVNLEGLGVELRVNARTGAVIHQEIDDDGIDELEERRD